MFCSLLSFSRLLLLLSLYDDDDMIDQSLIHAVLLLFSLRYVLA
jgi:hypothetical protein